jgi:hypothetical protein
MKPRLSKGAWSGNGWPCVDIGPYAQEDFLKVLTHLCVELGVPIPRIHDLLDGYAADLVVEGSRITLFMDPYTFSIAAEREKVRDRVLEALHLLA